MNYFLNKNKGDMMKRIIVDSWFFVLMIILCGIFLLVIINGVNALEVCEPPVYKDGANSFVYSQDCYPCRMIKDNVMYCYDNTIRFKNGIVVINEDILFEWAVSGNEELVRNAVLWQDLMWSIYYKDDRR